LTIAILLMLYSVVIRAEDVYVVQGSAYGAPISRYEYLYWSTATIVFNRGESPATITLLGVSNGGIGTTERTIQIPARRSESLQREVKWLPPNSTPLWVLKLDVPDNVLLENFLQIGVIFDLGGGVPPSSGPTVLGKVPLPVIRRLVPAQEEQLHLGSDLGRDQASRVNVSVYNAGSTPATAQIELRSHCTEEVLATRTVSVPAESLQQFTGFSVRIPACGGGAYGPENIYTRVVVDQPSFSFVSVLSTREVPLVSYGIAHSSR